ncbi:MAG TPA: DUF1761 domain-containing protein [Gammaproteobacteria bacterium]|nr:DUF1761 domain-containing protein [Gammaproteobacteria bacterium]
MSFHFFGIVIAAVVCFVFGGMWYSPMLFAKAWARESGTPDEHNPDPKAQARFFVILLVLLLVAATVLDYVLGHWAPGPALARGFTVGFMGGLLAAAVVAMDTLFERKSLKLFLINAGYYIVSFCVTGLILSLF